MLTYMQTLKRSLMMNTKQTTLVLLVFLNILMMSCDTTIASVDQKAKQDDSGIFSTYGVVDTADGDYIDDVRVVEVKYDHMLAATFFKCALLGTAQDETRIIRVRTSPCYRATKVVNPNDTISIWVHSCSVCQDGANYFYPPCK